MFIHRDGFALGVFAAAIMTMALVCSVIVVIVSTGWVVLTSS